MHADKLSILSLYIARPIILRILRIANGNNADYFAIMRKRRKLSGELIAHANITVRYCDNIAKLRNSRRGHIINYKNDKLHGLYMDSYLPDIISTLAIYDMGYKHGRSYDWYDNGALYTVIDYKCGSYSGEYYSWHANRIPLKYIRYRDGLVYGNYISW
jgi:antitoxin component YwqK of YwqJK toxin-antitoxin module